MKLIARLVFVAAVILPASALPCTTLFVSGSLDSVVGKNLDWPQGQGLILVNKRHVQKQSVFVNPPEALRWISKYMSLTFTQTGREFPWEGMNEAGLSMNIMVLSESTFPLPTDPRPAVNGLQWMQYILDTSATVDEAIRNARAVRIGGPYAIPDHYMVCDKTAKCATFEYLNQQLVIHAGVNLPYKALTNNNYDQSVSYLHALLATQDPKTIINTPSPKSLDRFARAALLSKSYSGKSNAVEYAFSALENAKQPITQWNLVFSLVPHTAHFRTMASPQIKFINLMKFNPNCSAPVKMFNMNTAVGGDISGQFLNYDSEVNRRLVEMGTIKAPEAKAVIEKFPESATRCLE